MKEDSPAPPTPLSTGRIEFSSAQLIPAAWLQQEPFENFTAYNPAIVRYGGCLLMAYRVDSSGEGSSRRRIAVCRLDPALQVMPGSVVALSDTIQAVDSRHYDPRFLVMGERLFIHFNNNYQTRPNRIYLVELDASTLEARAPARPVVLQGQRRLIEKNWMFFEHHDGLYAVYSIAPHVILQVDLAGSSAVVCRPVFTTEWNVAEYTTRYGLPRGGAPPVRVDETYLSFFHALRPVSRFRWVLQHWPIGPEVKLPRYLAAIEQRLKTPFAQVRYSGGAYLFAAVPPFQPVGLVPTPILRPEAEPPRQKRWRTNPWADGVVYPCGAVLQEDRTWLVSYGAQDEHCCLRKISHAALSERIIR